MSYNDFKERFTITDFSMLPVSRPPLRRFVTERPFNFYKMTVNEDIDTGKVFFAFNGSQDGPKLKTYRPNTNTYPEKFRMMDMEFRVYKQEDCSLESGPTEPVFAEKNFSRSMIIRDKVLAAGTYIVEVNLWQDKVCDKDPLHKKVYIDLFTHGNVDICEMDHREACQWWVDTTTDNIWKDWCYQTI